MNNNYLVENTLKQCALASWGKRMEMKSLRPLKNQSFTVDPQGDGFCVSQLQKERILIDHLAAIVKKANAMGGKMYRGDELPQVSSCKLDRGISRTCMEGFIAGDLLGQETGSSVTRRSTYYSGILAWAGIITIHKSDGQGSYIVVNPQYRHIL